MQTKPKPKIFFDLIFGHSLYISYVHFDNIYLKTDMPTTTLDLGFFFSKYIYIERHFFLISLSVSFSAYSCLKLGQTRKKLKFGHMSPNFWTYLT